MSRSRSALLTCLILAESLVFVREVGAQAAPASVDVPLAPESARFDEPASYRKTIEDAVREFEARNYAEARALFEQAHALYPNARTERGMGFAEFELRHYGQCIVHLEAALSSSSKPLTSELRRETEELLGRAKGFVGYVRVDAKPVTAAIVIDGVTVELPAGEPLMLDVGDHVIEARAPGYTPERRKLSLRGGEEQQLPLVLARQQTASKAKSERSWYKSPWLWASLGAVVAGAATATGIVLTRPEKSPSPYGGSADGVLSGP
jgi:hypothetical protein